MIDPSLIAHIAYSHDLIHWIDDLRHYLASSFSASAVGGNTGAAVYWWLGAALTSYAIWPKFRKAIDSWIKGHIHSHNTTQTAEFKQMLDDQSKALHDKIDANHESMKEHVISAINEAHKSLFDKE